MKPHRVPLSPYLTFFDLAYTPFGPRFPSVGVRWNFRSISLLADFPNSIREIQLPRQPTTRLSSRLSQLTTQEVKIINVNCPPKIQNALLETLHPLKICPDCSISTRMAIRVFSFRRKE